MTRPPLPQPTAVASPCVRRCTLDDHDVCVGCGRTLTEITGWTKMSPDQQVACVAQATQRLMDLKRPPATDEKKGRR